MIVSMGRSEVCKLMSVEGSALLDGKGVCCLKYLVAVFVAIAHGVIASDVRLEDCWAVE